jgi:signal transduction histidine kinase
MAALALVVLVGGGTYRLLAFYFQSTTDLALQYRVARELQSLGAPLPPELQDARRKWQASRSRLAGLVATPTARHSSDDEGEGEGEHAERLEDEPPHEEDYDGELAAIFVLPLSAEGQMLSDPAQFALPDLPVGEAALAAQRNGRDWRTVRLSNGMRVRVLSYAVPGSAGPEVLQAGRALADQDRLLNQMLAGLLALGGASAIALGAGSWWLAGRSLLPTQLAWENQQTFVANASHELRTPLTLMRASAEVALRGLRPDDGGQRELLNDVVHECDHMSRLVEDLLLLSRLDAGRLMLASEAVSLPELFAEVQRQVGRLAEERGVRLEAAASTGALAYGDLTRLRQVLLILLDNALRHTPAGGSIDLSAQTAGRQVQVAVADTGSGIAPEHLPHVFERFYRPGGEQAPGSGLGLAIAKGLIEAQNGQIHLESNPGGGTRITLLLPAAGQK